MSADWTDGYVADVEYLPGFYREQSPAFMDLACLIRGVQPPDRETGWTYCDLGCGQGTTCLLLAAANPDGVFIGIDFNPAHIARARELARLAGLANVTFIEASFETLAADPSSLPEFDYVALHGIYSWVSDASRRAIVALLSARLKPGGLAYVSYNVMPGWNAVAPFQRLFLEHSRLTGIGSERGIAEAIAFAEKLRAVGAPGLGDPEVLPRLRKELEKGNLSYLAHEYLNGHWRPLYHADVVRGLAEAKLAFVANGTILDNYAELSLTAEQREVLTGIADPVMREMLRDFLGVRAFRRDLYMRGARRLDARRRDARLNEVSLALVVGPSGIRREITVPIGKAELEPGLYGPVLDALSKEPMRLGDLIKLPGIRSREEPKALEIAGMLVGSGQALPIAGSRPKAEIACRQYNRMMINHVDFSPGIAAKALASPAARTGLHLTIFELFACGALLERAEPTVEALVDHTWARLKRTGDRLRREGQAIEDEGETRAILRTEMESVLREAVPVWRQLGIVQP